LWFAAYPPGRVHRAVPRDAPTSTASWPVSGPSRANTADRSAVLPLPQIGSSVDMAPGLRELIGLALLAGPVFRRCFRSRYRNVGGSRRCDVFGAAFRKLREDGCFLHECVDEQDYNDGTQNDRPIGNLNARYRRFLIKPFHDFSSPDRPPPLAASSVASSYRNNTGSDRVVSIRWGDQWRQISIGDGRSKLGSGLRRHPIHPSKPAGSDCTRIAGSCRAGGVV
jgi:hypothetical protein